jgi:hypothetical protein
MTQNNRKAPAPAAPAGTTQSSEPIPFGSREDQTERRHPGAEIQPSLEERRKTDHVGGED